MLVGPLVQRAFGSAVRGLWFGLVPAALALASVYGMLPDPFAPQGTGLKAEFAGFLKTHVVELFAVLLMVYRALLHYWRFYLPGRRQLVWMPGSRRQVSPEQLRQLAAPAETLKLLSRRRWQEALAAKLNARERRRLRQGLLRLSRALRRVDVEAAESAHATLAELGAPVLRRHSWRETAGVVGVLTLALVGATWLDSSVAKVYRVESISMLPTLNPSDHLLTSKWTTRIGGIERGGIERGDIIVFENNYVLTGPPLYTKRVIGVPGDTVVVEGGLVTINGWTIPICDAGPYAAVSSEGGVSGRVMVEWLGNHAYLTLFRLGKDKFSYRVQPGEVFVLGDNRSRSVDSRTFHSRRGGGVEEADIIGRALFVLFTRRRDGTTDWKRLGAPLELQASQAGVDLSALETRIQRCLEHPPDTTTPPPPHLMLSRRD